eukprot:3184989-Amphidinium_carterae.2
MSHLSNTSQPSLIVARSDMNYSTFMSSRALLSPSFHLSNSLSRTGNVSQNCIARQLIGLSIAVHEQTNSRNMSRHVSVIHTNYTT